MRDLYVKWFVSFCTWVEVEIEVAMHDNVVIDGKYTDHVGITSITFANDFHSLVFRSVLTLLVLLLRFDLIWSKVCHRFQLGRVNGSRYRLKKFRTYVMVVRNSTTARDLDANEVLLIFLLQLGWICSG